MVEGVIPIEELYPNLVSIFPTFGQELATFLEKHHGQIARLNSPCDEIEQYVGELTKLAALLAKGIKRMKNPKELYLEATALSKLHSDFHPGDPYQVGVMKGKHHYHILNKVSKSSSNDFLLLNQRVPYQSDTGAEVHRSGIEIYVPLTNGIVFHINEDVFTPSALGGIVRILPGDIHHHSRETLGPKNKHGPARVLIVAGFGFGLGTKIPPESRSLEIEGFGKIPVASFDRIPRFVPFK